MRKGPCLITAKWEQKSRFFTRPLLILEVSRGSSLLLGKGRDSGCSGGLLGSERQEYLITVPPVASSDTTGGRGIASLLWEVVESPDSHPGFF